jgi:hypothetical protein
MKPEEIHDDVKAVFRTILKRTTDGHQFSHTPAMLPKVMIQAR